MSIDGVEYVLPPNTGGAVPLAAPVTLDELYLFQDHIDRSVVESWKARILRKEPIPMLLVSERWQDGLEAGKRSLYDGYHRLEALTELGHNSFGAAQQNL